VSKRNVGLHRRVIEAFNAHDVEAFLAIVDPQAEFHSGMTIPGGAVYHGHDGIRKYLRDMEDAWSDETRLEPEAYFDLGEQSLAFYTGHGRGRESGLEIAAPWAQVVRWRDGLGVYFKAYPRREEALKELGISEEALEPIAP
jgi:ketosteroid isomerase-like protein